MCNPIKVKDEKWLTHLMRAYYTPMFNYGKKFCRDEELVKDCIQEVFISLWQRRDTAHEILSAKYYFLRAIKNKVLKALDNAARLTDAHALSDGYEFMDDFSVENTIISRELAVQNGNRLRSLLSGLPKREKEVIYLKYYQLLDNGQIAQLMNINRQSVYNLLSVSILRLRQCWQSEFVM
jgi:RNA polymerase sigma factor (sigma-70 family)